MKKAVLILFIFVVVCSQAQKLQQKIGTNPTLIDPSAALEIESTTKGLLLPRMTTAQRSAISLPAVGLTIYNTTTNVIEVNTGSTASPVWTAVGSSGSGSTTVSVTEISPILSATGRVWMDRNLGASRKAQSVNDFLAYGQLYQWGRGNDGHADISWTSATAGTLVNGLTTIQSTTDYPANNLFISNTTDWRATANNNLWQGINGINNPCPAGYRIPTLLEFNAEITAYNITNSATAFASPLKFTLSGNCRNNGSIDSSNSTGFYWSSSFNISFNSESNFFTFTSASASTSSRRRSFGLSVRCIKD